jgi:serine kinase of HPr protein (carbohydrate metabolism regulator)
MANIHGTGLVLDGYGLLVRGRSGAGKSLLALQLLDIWRDRGREAFLISDDRIDLNVEKGALIMSAPPTNAGLIELRGRGIVSRPSHADGQLHLVVDLVGELIRFLEEEDLVTDIDGVEIARCPVPERAVVDSAHQILLVGEALRELAAVSAKPAKRPRHAASKK